jgi:type I restriction enzyme R subunit
MSPHAYTEDQLVEQPAIGLFAELGWQTVSARKDDIVKRLMEAAA